MNDERAAWWRFGNWRLRNKLLLTSLLPVTVVTGLLVLLFWFSLQKVWQDAVPRKVALLRLEALTREYQAELREYTLLGLASTRDEIDEIVEEVPEVLTNLEAIGSAEASEPWVAEIEPLVEALLLEGQRLVEAVETSPRSEIPEARGALPARTHEAFEDREQALEQHIASQIELADAELGDAVDRFGWMLAISSLLGLAIGGLLVWQLSRRLRQPLMVLQQASDRILDGDFRARDKVRSRDELGDLAAGFDRGAAEIRRLVDVARGNLQSLKDNQAQLLQSGKLAAVGELAAGVAHELNNPLSAVLTYSVLVREKVAAGPEKFDPDQLVERLGLIESAARRCKDIADKLLTFSRQDEEEDLGPVALGDVVEDALDLLRAMLKRRGLRLEQMIDLEAPKVHGNAGQLQQVLVNLVSNAAQAMESEGLLRVEVKTLGSQVALIVQDDGPGIDPQVRDRVFEPFVTSKPPGQGTGLGLSIVYGVVKSHHGEIDLESEVGRGTKFTVRLPALDGPSAQQGVARA